MSIQIIHTQRGKRKLLFDGYIYRLDRSNNRGIEQWRCSKKNCRGRIHFHHSFVFSSSINSTNINLISSHSHPSEPAQCEAAILIDHIRTNARYNSHETPKEIVHRLLKTVNDETVANLPSITAMQRSIQRRRQQQKSFDSLSNNIEILYHSINDHLLLNLTELKFNQILICKNEENYRNKLTNNSIWLCTTFNEIFLQQCILIIQIFDNEDQIFIPIVYIFLPSNSIDFYLKVFDELFSFQTPKYLLTNFDKILIDSLKKFFLNRSILPNIKICSIFLYNELCKVLQQDKQTIHLKSLLTLAYIPQSDIIMAFEALQTTCLSSTEGVYDKFEDLCIGRLRPNGQRSSALFPSTLWNWVDVISDFDNLLVINLLIKQWDEIFRTFLLSNPYQNLSKIIQQFHQYEINRNNHQIEANVFVIKNFQELIQSYHLYSFKEYLLHLFEYLPC